MIPHFTLAEYILLLEAFTNWMDYPENWTDDGKAVNPKYQTVIDKLDAKISQLGG